MTQISIRQTRTFLAACKSSSISGAAKAINRSQTSVTKLLQDLERELGVELFDRSSKGITLTAYGKAFEKGALAVAEAFAIAGQLMPPKLMQNSPSVARFFQMDVSDKWLDAFLATAEHQSVNAAANHLNVTSAAVSANLRKLEDALNTSLFERLPRATYPTAFSRSLLQYIKLARSHLRHACNELSAMRGEKSGQVAVGSLPFVRTLILPRAITRMREQHPYIDVSTLEGRYDDLISALRCGDLDFVVGALRLASVDPDLTEERLLEDELAIIVRAGHPLLARKEIEWPGLLDFEWVLPRHGTPTRELFEAAITDQGLESPQHVVETSSTVIVRGLLLETDQVTVLSRHQIHYEETHGMLAVVPFALPGTRRPIGITKRANGSTSLATQLLVDELNAVAKGS